MQGGAPCASGRERGVRGSGEQQAAARVVQGGHMPVWDYKRGRGVRGCGLCGVNEYLGHEYMMPAHLSISNILPIRPE